MIYLLTSFFSHFTILVLEISHILYVINISHPTTKGKNLCAILENFFNFRKQKPQNVSEAL